MTDLSDLTPRQREVASLVADGLPDHEIAARLHMQYNTVRVHLAGLAERLEIERGQHTRVLIARWWWRRHPTGYYTE